MRREADRIGFRSDPIARALRGGRTGTWSASSAAASPTTGTRSSSPTSGARCASNDLRLLLADADGDPAAELELAQDLADRRVDGLIVLPLDPSAAGLARGSPARRRPCR